MKITLQEVSKNMIALTIAEHDIEGRDGLATTAILAIVINEDTNIM